MNMVQGQAVVGRPAIFPMGTAGLSMGQDQLCSQQAVVDVYGNLSPNMVSIAHSIQTEHPTFQTIR